MPNPTTNPAIESDKAKAGSVGSLEGIPIRCLDTSASLTEFYKSQEDFSPPKELEINNTEFVYSDLKFPAHTSSLGACKSIGNHEIIWERPRNITENPEFYPKESAQFDITQGLLKNSWFLAAVSSLTRRNELLQKVVPMDQSFDEHYTGIFRFRFWQYGKWVDVIVDDQLPTYRDKGERRFFGAQPTPENTFWLPLLEKAYAKLHGSYQAIERSSDSQGRSGEAMEDFTGGISDYYTPEYNGNGKVEFYKISKKAWENQSLITCYIEDGSYHCSVKHFVQDSSSSSPTVEIVRIRHSNETSSDGSESKDSKFTMTEEEFNQKCASVEICHLELKEFNAESSPSSKKKAWQLCEIHGEWETTSAEPMKSAPRYFFKLEEDGNVIISVMRKHEAKNDPKSRDLPRFGFRLYSGIGDTDTEMAFNHYGMGDDERVKQTESDSSKLVKTESAPDSIQRDEDSRVSNCRLQFKGGYYRLDVYNPDDRDGGFFLRIFSDNKITMKADTERSKRPNGVAVTPTTN